MNLKLHHADIVKNAKEGDFDAALKLYEEALASIASPPTWFIACPVSLISSCTKLGSSSVSTEQVKRCMSMCESLNVAESETLSSSLIRLCVAVDLIDEAVLYKKSATSKKLRTFQPLLWFHSKQKNVAELHNLWNELKLNKIEPTQAEFALMIEGGVELNSFLEALSLRFDEVIDPALALAITSRATSDQILVSESSDVTDEGICPVTGVQLKAVGLTDGELADLLGLTRRLITESSNAVDIDALEALLHKQETATVVLDGANIAHTNQNYAEGFFRYIQIEEVRQHFDRKSLIVLHRKWLKRKTNLRQNLVETVNPKKRKLPPLSPLPTERKQTKPKSDSESEAEDAVEYAKQWRAVNELVEVPRGANDDWYWLYATLWLETKRRHRGDVGSVLLVSNDLMRDHLFRMSVDERIWEKFKHRHLCRFRICYPCPEKSEEREYDFYLPPPFSRCLQRTENFWHIPCKGSGFIVLKT